MRALRRSCLFVAMVLGLALLGSDAAGREESTSPSEPLFKADEAGGSQRGAQVLGLVVLTGVIGAGVIQWHRRRGRTQGTNIRVVAIKPLGQREKVAVLEVLGERMVLGITAHQISLLAQGPGSFSEMMRQEDKQA
jgi:flagellar biogenesis protein FliO